MPRTLVVLGQNLNKMYYVYVLQSRKDGKRYIGQSDDLRRRISEHENGKLTSTKHRRPIKLIFYEAFSAKEDAIRRERYFKTSKGKSTLDIMLRESTKE